MPNPFPEIANPLGPLAGFAGKWAGRGFNVIWRPDSVSGQDRFLELNVTSDQLEFSPISGPIPDSGFDFPEQTLSQPTDSGPTRRADRRDPGHG